MSYEVLLITRMFFEEIKKNGTVNKEDFINYFSIVSQTLDLITIKDCVDYKHEDKVMATINPESNVMKIDFDKIYDFQTNKPKVKDFNLTKSDKLNNYILSILYYFYHEVSHDLQQKPGTNLHPIVASSLAIMKEMPENYMPNHDLFPFEQEALVNGYTIIYYMLKGSVPVDLRSLNLYYLRSIKKLYKREKSLYEMFKKEFKDYVLEDDEYEYVTKDISLYDRISMGLDYNKKELRKIENECIFYMSIDDIPKLLRKIK